MMPSIPLVLVLACGDGLSADPTGTTPAGGPGTGTGAPTTGLLAGTPGGTPAGSAGGVTTGSTADTSGGTPGGTAPGTSAGTSSGTPSGTTTAAPWSSTPVVDGDPSEYTADETFPIDQGTVWITWDADALYVAVQHPDVITGGSAHWLLVYVGDGTTGSSVGVTHNTQQPALALPASALVRWKLDDSFDSRSSWTGTEWLDSPSWLGTGGSQVSEDPVAGVVEMRLPYTPLGLTDPLAVHVSLLYEGNNYESSYGPSPSVSFLSGSYDPDYTAFWLFDRTSAAAPASYAPVY